MSSVDTPTPLAAGGISFDPGGPPAGQPVFVGPETPVEAGAPPEKKIAIVGFTSSREEAPWQDPSFEIWICNNLYQFVPDTWHRLYDLHDNKMIKSDGAHDLYLRNCRKTVVVFDPQPEWPAAQRFPQEVVNQAFGRYFTNSISWMIANAIVENATEIHVYGVDMAQGTEYAAQRPSCEYFLGLAVGMGIKTYVPPSSDLLKNITMYGAEDDTGIRAKMENREKDLSERLGALQNQHGQMMAQMNQLQGALEDVRYWQAVWLNAHANRDGSAKTGAQPAQSDGKMVDLTQPQMAPAPVG